LPLVAVAPPQPAAAAVKRIRSTVVRITR
jgi:hypothetical protein